MNTHDKIKQEQWDIQCVITGFLVLAELALAALCWGVIALGGLL